MTSATNGSRKMISKEETLRIQNDAYIIIDCMKGICSGGFLHERYLKEKAEVAQRCLNHMKTFYQESEEEAQ